MTVGTAKPAQPIIVGNLSVMAPEIERSYPIPCKEWDYLKDGIRAASLQQWILPTLGSVLVGASLAEFGTLLVGAIPDSPPKLAAYAWAFVAGAGIGGIAFLLTALLRGRDAHTKGSSVLRHMELIEGRFAPP